MPPSRTIYFLANDTMYEFVIAFLNSLRAYNPATPLCFIPYDEDVHRVRALEREYRFTTWSDAAVLARCDRISEQFHGTVVGQYRKLAMWEGSHEQFLYIDTDTVVLTNLDFVFGLLDAVAFLTSHSNLPDLRQWVWKPTMEQSGALTEAQIAFSANTGFIASHRGLLRFDVIQDRLKAALALAPHMELLCTEQPLLNYLFVTSDLRYDSLLMISARTSQPRIPRERWGGSQHMEIRHGRVTYPWYPPTLLVHWAGLWRRLAEGSLPYADLWRFYRDLRERTGLPVTS
jgi:hypothetical protein